MGPGLDVVADSGGENLFPLDGEPVAPNSVEPLCPRRDEGLVELEAIRPVRGIRHVDRCTEVRNLAAIDAKNSGLLPGELSFFQQRRAAARAEIHDPLQDLALSGLLCRGE